MRAVPRRLLLFPRPDLGRPGIEVTELRLRSSAGHGLRGLFARSAFAGGGLVTRLRMVGDAGPEELDWECIQSGSADLQYCRPAESGPLPLEDRVLDVLRVARAATTLDGVEARRIRVFQPADRPFADELLIAQKLLGSGLC